MCKITQPSLKLVLEDCKINHYFPLLNTGFSIAGAPQLRVGLDEELSVPDDSYLIKYFDYMQKYLSVGPPFYVVLNNTGKDGFDLSGMVVRWL